MKIAAGYLVKCGDLFLLGRPFGRDNKWTIFKGTQERDESLIQTAIRELKEESGIDILSGKIKGLDSPEQYTRIIHKYIMEKANKIVYVYLLDLPSGALKNFKFRCYTNIEDTDDPEISGYQWFTHHELYDALLLSQKGLAKIARKLVDN